MAMKGLHDRLTEFGFSEDEAEIYVFLAAMGPTPARLVARRFDINRMKAYRTLKDLEERGYIQRIMGRPIKFVVEPIKNILDEQLVEARDKLEKMESNKGRIINEFERLSTSESPVSDEPRFRIYQGRQQVYELLAQMIDRVSSDISIITTPYDFLRFSLWGIDAMLINLSSEGKRVRVMTQVNESNIHEIEAIVDYIDIRHIDMPSPVRFVIVDGEEALNTVSMDDSMSMTTMEDTGLWTNAEGFSASMKAFIDSIWNLAPDANMIINSIRTGRKPQEFQTIRSFTEYASTFRSMVKGSRSQIDVIVDRLEDLPISIDEIKEFINKKDTRVLTHVDQSQRENLNRFTDQADVRHNSAESNITLLIVDRREILLTTISDITSVQAVWSNLSSYTDSMNLVFNDYWKNATPAEERFRELNEIENKYETLEKIKNELQAQGWRVQMPGNVVGNSGSSYVFDIYAESADPSNRKLVLYLNSEEDAFNQVFELSTKKTDIGDVIPILASIKPFEEEVNRLASLYSITIVQSNDARRLGKEIASI
jgi:sugar-specific transcriptional regulator TrmB